MPEINSKEYVERAKRSLLIVPGNRTVFAKGEGVYLFDTEGKRYLDITARAGMVSFGHQNPTIMEGEAEMRKAGIYSFESIGDHWNTKISINGKEMEISPAALAERLIEITYGKGHAYVIPKESGATTVSSFLKLAAMLRPARRYFASFSGAYHGRVGYAEALTQTRPAQKNWFPSGLPVVTFPFLEVEKDLERAKEILLRVGYENMNVVTFEGVQSEGGMRSQNPELVRTFMNDLKKHDVFVMADEIYSGFYRTGKKFSFEHYGFVPDAITMAKVLGQGIPIGAAIVSEDVFKKSGINSVDACKPGWEGGTFVWNAHAVARAIIVLNSYGDELGDHVRKMAKYFEAGFKPHEALSLTGIGLMRGICFRKDGKALPKLRDTTSAKLWLHQVTGAGTGHADINPTIRFTPPLSIGKEHIDEFWASFHISFAEALSEVGLS